MTALITTLHQIFIYFGSLFVLVLLNKYKIQTETQAVKSDFFNKRMRVLVLLLSPKYIILSFILYYKIIRQELRDTLYEDQALRGGQS